MGGRGAAPVVVGRPGGGGHEAQHAGSLRDGGAGRPGDARRGRPRFAHRPVAAPGHQPGLSRAALRQAPPRGARRVGARAGRGLPAGAPGDRDPHRGRPRSRGRDRQRHAHRRGRHGGRVGLQGAGPDRSALGGAFGPRLRVPAPDAADRRGARRPHAVPGRARPPPGRGRGEPGGGGAPVSGRAYLDWNASAPLRSEARAAMAATLDVVGNPSSVHAEGRAARAVVERARAQVAAALGAADADMVFTSGATEAAALALAGRGLLAAGIEHEAVAAWTREALPTAADGTVEVSHPAGSTLQAANGETGVVQALPAGLAVVDATQAFGKLPFAFDASGAAMALVSAHKIGGPKGVGALVLRRGLDLDARIRGGGQEMGRRSGTENVAGIAGFGAASEAAARDLAAGTWDEVSELRNVLESLLEEGAPETISVGKGAPRLPNTACFASPGWKGETQVMRMDLAGYAVSAGSACSSGKVRASRVLTAMGFGPEVAASAIRVSLGPATTEAEVRGFAEAWLKAQERRSRAA